MKKDAMTDDQLAPLCIRVCRADGIGGEETLPTVLAINDDLPPRHLVDMAAGWEGRMRAQFRGDAERVMQALSSLPGGTLDQLLLILLERKASLFRVAYSTAYVASDPQQPAPNQG